MQVDQTLRGKHRRHYAGESLTCVLPRYFDQFLQTNNGPLHPTLAANALCKRKKQWRKVQSMSLRASIHIIISLTCDGRDRDLFLILLGVSLEIKEVPNRNSGSIESTNIFTIPKHLSSILVRTRQEAVKGQTRRRRIPRVCFVRVYLPCDGSNLPTTLATFFHEAVCAYVDDAWRSATKKKERDRRPQVSYITLHIIPRLSSMSG